MSRGKSVILKFGGTSVASVEGREQLVAKVQARLHQGYRVLVVVSAMGRSPEPYATDTLKALAGEQEEYVDLAERDRAMACGEVLSTIVVAHDLRAQGIKARAVDPYEVGIICEDKPGNAKITAIHPEYLESLMSSDMVPVVGGFMGLTDRLKLRTLGRGASDTTAVALGAALGSERVEIFTDVDGVLTSDPRIFAEAQIMEQIHHQELNELATEGAKVVHSRAVDLAGSYGVPVWVRNTFKDSFGTYVSTSPRREVEERQKILTGIAHRNGLFHLTVALTENHERLAFLKSLYDSGISLDLINLTEHRIYAAIVDIAENLAIVEQKCMDLGVPYNLRSGCAKISVVGAGMRGTPGVMYRLIECLQQGGIDVIQATDSNITISFLVAEEQLAAGIDCLHTRFLPRDTAGTR